MVLNRIGRSLSWLQKGLSLLDVPAPDRLYNDSVTPVVDIAQSGVAVGTVTSFPQQTAIFGGASSFTYITPGDVDYQYLIMTLQLSGFVTSVDVAGGGSWELDYLLPNGGGIQARLQQFYQGGGINICFEGLGMMRWLPPGWGLALGAALIDIGSNVSLQGTFLKIPSGFDIAPR